MTVHSEDRHFWCVVCKKLFSHRSILHTHLRVHTGETVSRAKCAPRNISKHASDISENTSEKSQLMQKFKDMSVFHPNKLQQRIYSGQGQGQGYITTNNQSVSMSWYRAQSRTIDQSLLSP
jgi:hypothetical protein